MFEKVLEELERMKRMQCPKSEASMAVIYDDAGPYHAGLDDPATDTYTAKGGVSPEGTYVGETNFWYPNGTNGDPRYNVGEIVYYKMRQYNFI